MSSEIHGLRSSCQVLKRRARLAFPSDDDTLSQLIPRLLISRALCLVTFVAVLFVFVSPPLFSVAKLSLHSLIAASLSLPLSAFFFHASSISCLSFSLLIQYPACLFTFSDFFFFSLPTCTSLTHLFFRSTASYTPPRAFTPSAHISFFLLSLSLPPLHPSPCFL